MKVFSLRKKLSLLFALAAIAIVAVSVSMMSIGNNANAEEQNAEPNALGITVTWDSTASSNPGFDVDWDDFSMSTGCDDLSGEYYSDSFVDTNISQGKLVPSLNKSDSNYYVYGDGTFEYCVYTQNAANGYYVLFTPRGVSGKTPHWYINGEEITNTYMNPYAFSDGNNVFTLKYEGGEPEPDMSVNADIYWDAPSGAGFTFEEYIRSDESVLTYDYEGDPYTQSDDGFIDENVSNCLIKPSGDQWSSVWLSSDGYTLCYELYQTGVGLKIDASLKPNFISGATPVWYFNDEEVVPGQYYYFDVTDDNYIVLSYREPKMLISAEATDGATFDVVYENTGGWSDLSDEAVESWEDTNVNTGIIQPVFGEDYSMYVRWLDTGQLEYEVCADTSYNKFADATLIPQHIDGKIPVWKLNGQPVYDGLFQLYGEYEFYLDYIDSDYVDLNITAQGEVGHGTFTYRAYDFDAPEGTPPIKEVANVDQYSDELFGGHLFNPEYDSFTCWDNDFQYWFVEDDGTVIQVTLGPDGPEKSPDFEIDHWEVNGVTITDDMKWNDLLFSDFMEPGQTSIEIVPVYKERTVKVQGYVYEASADLPGVNNLVVTFVMKDSGEKYSVVTETNHTAEGDFDGYFEMIVPYGKACDEIIYGEGYVTQHIKYTEGLTEDEQNYYVIVPTASADYALDASNELLDYYTYKYFVDDVLVYESEEPISEMSEAINAGATYNVDELNNLVLSWINPNPSNEESADCMSEVVTISAVPVENYYVTGWNVDDEELVSGTEIEEGDFPVFSANFDKIPDVPVPVPAPVEEVDATAQTGDSAAILYVVTALIAMVGTCGAFATRKYLIKK